MAKKRTHAEIDAAVAHAMTTMNRLYCRGPRLENGEHAGKFQDEVGGGFACGYDLRVAIAHIPDAWNGETHSYSCPECGVPHTYTATVLADPKP